MTFAEKLQELRSKSGMTQAQLAAASGIPLWTVRNYEQGRREPNWKGAFQLADALSVAVEVFRACISTDAVPRRSRKPDIAPKRQRGRPKKKQQ